MHLTPLGIKNNIFNKFKLIKNILYFFEKLSTP